MGLQNILIESDCLVLVTACRKETEIGEISSIVQDILQLKQNVRNCGFTWVGRSGNKLAHTLAKMAHRDSLPTNWRWNLPLQLKLIVDLEARHIEHRDGPFIRQQNPTNGLSSTCGISRRNELVSKSSSSPSLTDFQRSRDPSFPPDPRIS